MTIKKMALLLIALMLALLIGLTGCSKRDAANDGMGSGDTTPAGQPGKADDPPSGQTANPPPATESTRWRNVQLEGEYRSLIQGDGVVITRMPDNALAVTSDGENWKLVNPGFEVPSYNLTYVGDRFFNTTQSWNHQYYSSNGITWTKFNMDRLDPPEMMVQSHDGYIAIARRRVLVSEDGAMWEVYIDDSTGRREHVYKPDLRHLSYNQGRYYLIFDDRIEYGTTIENLSNSVPTNQRNMQGTRFLFAEDVTVVWGGPRVYHLSASGLEQIDAANTGGGGFMNLFVQGGQFYGVKFNGDIYRSSDGRNFELAIPGPEGHGSFGGSAFIGGRLLLIFEGQMMYVDL